MKGHKVTTGYVYRGWLIQVHPLRDGNHDSEVYFDCARVKIAKPAKTTYNRFEEAIAHVDRKSTKAAKV